MSLTCVQLKNIGIDIDGVLSRLGGNETLYQSICLKFVEDPNYQLILDANVKNDMVLLEIRIHTLKGVASNLGFTKLAFLCKTLLEKIRNYDFALFQEDINSLSSEYNLILSVIKGPTT